MQLEAVKLTAAAPTAIATGRRRQLNGDINGCTRSFALNR